MVKLHLRKRKERGNSELTLLLYNMEAPCWCLSISGKLDFCGEFSLYEYEYESFSFLTILFLFMLSTTVIAHILEYANVSVIRLPLSVLANYSHKYLTT